MVYQAWRLAGFCATLIWCCMQVGLSDCRDFYWLSPCDDFSGVSGLTFRSVLECLLMPALVHSIHLYCFRIDALLLSSNVEIITLSRLVRVKTCVCCY